MLTDLFWLLHVLVFVYFLLNTIPAIARSRRVAGIEARQAYMRDPTYLQNSAIVEDVAARIARGDDWYSPLCLDAV